MRSRRVCVCVSICFKTLKCFLTRLPVINPRRARGAEINDKVNGMTSGRPGRDDPPEFNISNANPARPHRIPRRFPPGTFSPDGV